MVETAGIRRRETREAERTGAGAQREKFGARVGLPLPLEAERGRVKFVGGGGLGGAPGFYGGFRVNEHGLAPLRPGRDGGAHCGPAVSAPGHRFEMHEFEAKKGPATPVFQAALRGPKGDYRRSVRMLRIRP